MWNSPVFWWIVLVMTLILLAEAYIVFETVEASKIPVVM